MLYKHGIDVSEPKTGTGLKEPLDLCKESEASATWLLSVYQLEELCLSTRK